MTRRRSNHPRARPAQPRRAGHLPREVNRLIGRAREVAMLRRRLQERDARLLTLTGPAGVGKTRIALAVAAGSRAAFAGGAYVVDLAPLADPGLVMPAVARALGIREPRPADRSIRAELEAFCQDEELLLVLDNFEHLLGAATEVAELLAACRGLSILATSRAPLHVYAEHEFPVPSLELPDPRAPPRPSTLARVASVALFVERARAAKPDFALTAANAGAVAELCVRLDGLPLAIELAAARIKMLPPRAILARLGGAPGPAGGATRAPSLALLTRGARDLSTRHQTMRAAIDGSYALLDPAEQALFRQLAVFVGGCTPEAAEAVCAGAESGETRDESGGSRPLSSLVSPLSTLDGLASLVDQSLVRSDEPAAGEPRLLMLATIREYALDRLQASGEEASARRRHAEFYLALAEEADPRLRGVDQLGWLDRLEREHDNLRAALAWSVSEAGDPATALRLVAALSWFWYLRGHLGEGRRWLERALGIPSGGPTLARGRALNGAGNLAYAHGDYGGAAAAYEESLAVFRELGDRTNAANALNNLGNLARARGDYGRAMALLEETLALRREAGDQRGTALALNNLGLVAQHQGDDERARALFEECLAINRQLGDRHNVALALTNLATAAQYRGDLARAAALHEENLALCRALGDARGIANALNNLGTVAEERGDYDRATALFEESQALARELGDQGGSALALHNLGNVARARGQYGRSAALFEEALAHFRRLGDQRGAAWALNGLGSANRGLGDGERAVMLLEESAALFRELGDRRGRAWALKNLGDVARERGDHARAASLYDEACALARDIGDRSAITACLEGLAGLAAARGEWERAARLFGVAEAQREGIGSPLPPGERAGRERDLAAARGTLGEDAFAAARATGRALTPDLALEDVPTPRRAPPSLGGRGIASADDRAAAPLTRREREVARLIARGMTNRQIAAELAITEGTVGSHVEHILRKLDLQSRTQVAGWAFRRGLVSRDLG